MSKGARLINYESERYNVVYASMSMSIAPQRAKLRTWKDAETFFKIVLEVVIIMNDQKLRKTQFEWQGHWDRVTKRTQSQFCHEQKVQTGRHTLRPSFTRDRKLIRRKCWFHNQGAVQFSSYRLLLRHNALTSSRCLSQFGFIVAESISPAVF